MDIAHGGETNQHMQVSAPQLDEVMPRQALRALARNEELNDPLLGSSRVRDLLAELESDIPYDSCLVNEVLKNKRFNCCK